MFIEGGRIYPTAPLKQLCSKIGSGATPKGGKTAYQESGVSLVRSTNVFDYAFSYDDLAHISDEQADQLSNVVVEENDVLFNITGVSVTRCCIVPADVLPARVNQHVMILRPKTAMPMSYYIMTTLCSAENKAKLMGIAQSGSTREAINKQEMESFSIPVPPYLYVTRRCPGCSGVLHGGNSNDKNHNFFRIPGRGQDHAHQKTHPHGLQGRKAGAH